MKRIHADGEATKDSQEATSDEDAFSDEEEFKVEEQSESSDDEILEVEVEEEEEDDGDAEDDISECDIVVWDTKKGRMRQKNTPTKSMRWSNRAAVLEQFTGPATAEFQFTKCW